MATYQSFSPSDDVAKFVLGSPIKVRVRAFASLTLVNSGLEDRLNLVFEFSELPHAQQAWRLLCMMTSMVQEADIAVRVAALPPPPMYLPTSALQGLPGANDQVKAALSKPLLAAAPQTAARRYETIRTALGVELGLMATLALALSLAFTGLISISEGLSGILVLAAALIPLPLMLAFGLWLDRYEPEPPWLLARALMWGAGAAVVMAAIINGVFSGVLGEGIGAIVGAPFAEEALKAMAIWWVFRNRLEHFNGVKDAVVYALFVGTGFAIVEDVLYYTQQLAEHDTQQLFTMIALRGGATPFMHAFFASFTAVGIARVAAGAGKKTLVKWYLLAVFLHGLWNSGIGVMLYPVLYFPLFIWGLLRLRKQRRIEAETVNEGVGTEVVTGLIDGVQFASILSKTTLKEFCTGLASSSHEIHARRRMQAAAWSLASHRREVMQRYGAGQSVQPLDRSIDDYLRLLLQIRAHDWTLVRARLVT